MSIGYKKQSSASVPTPAAGEMNTFVDAADDKLKRKDEFDVVTDLESAAAGVGSFEGRNGVVVSAAGDYTAAEVTNVPAGNISGITVQAAINELDTEKAPVTHVGAGGVSEHALATGGAAGFMSPSDFTKLAGVATGATANDTDANLKARANHTGTQLAATISDFTTASRSAVVDDSIVDGVTDKSPSQNSVFDALALKIPTSEKGSANGVATLDGSSKIPIAQIPTSLIGGVSYQGTWDASTNSPALASNVGTKGHYYVVNVAGSTNLNGITDWKVGDWAIFNGSVWEKTDNTDFVTSVNGLQGTVVLDTDDISESSNLYFTDARAITAVVDDAILNGVTNKAPSQNAVFDSLALKLTDPMTTIGDLVHRNSSNVTARLPVGSTNQVIKVVGGVPTYQDEDVSFFGDGSDGNLTLSGALSLSNLSYYNTLTLNAGAVLNPSGYPIYCLTLDLSNAPAGSIARNGIAGTSVVGNGGGAGGAALAGAMIGGGVAGSAGAGGSTLAGTASGAGAGSNPGYGGGGGNSGASGAGSGGAGVAAGAGGAVSNLVHFGRLETQFIRAATLITGGAGGDGGNSGGGDGVNSSRGAGGGGGSGALVVIYAKNIITTGSTASGVIQAMGGNGGNGAAAPLGNAGGSSGAGGGGGGGVYIAYATKTGAPVTSLINCTGGNGANGGNGIGTGIGGNGGQGGTGGIIQTFNVFNGVGGTQVIGAAGSSGTAGVGIVGGAGGAGGSSVLNF